MKTTHQNYTAKFELDETAAAEMLEQIRTGAKAIETSYLGKKGCMCGCLGTYREKQSTIASRAKLAARQIEDGQVASIYYDENQYVCIHYWGGAYGEEIKVVAFYF